MAIQFDAVFSGENAKGESIQYKEGNWIQIINTIFFILVISFP